MADDSSFEKAQLSQDPSNEPIRKVSEELAALFQKTSDGGLDDENGGHSYKEPAFASQHAHLFSLMNGIPLFVSLIDRHYKIIFANTIFKNLFGDIDERPCYLLKDNPIHPCQGSQFLNVLQTGVPAEFDWTSPNGKSYQIFEYPFTDTDGSRLVLELGIDRTQRKQMEVQLEQTNQALLSLSQAERSQRLLTEGLIEASAALNSSLDLQDVFDRILDQIQRVIPFDAANISLLEADQLCIVRQRGYEKYPQAMANIDLPFTLEDYPLLCTADGQPTFVFVQDSRNQPGWRIVPGLEWVLSCISTPLTAGSTFLGFLRLYSGQAEAFRQEHIDILKAFSIHASIAIRNARLYADLAEALENEKSMRAQLVQSEKLAAIGRTIASVSHELNNPLQTIKNCLYLIQQAAGEDPGYIREPLQMANAEAQRISDLVSKLRELYRPNKAAPAHLIPLNEIINEVHTLLAPQLSARGVEWRQDVGSEKFNPMILAIPDQLKQVFINICVNAIEAMSTVGGSLEVRLKKDVEANRIGVCFKDSGCGIAAEDIPKLFEPFFTTKSEGTGLGLPICLEIIQRHGGQITVESMAGFGTTFVVWLPITGSKKRKIKLERRS